MEGMESLILASLALIYFYALRWDDIPKGRRWSVYGATIVIISWGIASIIQMF
jgi:hypothetical protein